MKQIWCLLSPPTKSLMFLVIPCLCFMVRTRACLINSTLLWHFPNRQKYSCLLLTNSKEQRKTKEIEVFRVLGGKINL